MSNSYGPQVRFDPYKELAFFLQRIEPRCRDDNFARGLEVRTADPLWMLSRQWQVKEFELQNSGSPISVELKTTTQRTQSAKLGHSGPTVELSPDSPPLELLIEREHIELDWRARVQIGQHLERLLRARSDVNAQRVICNLRQKYPIQRPNEQQQKEIDRATQRFLTAMAGRAIDGKALLEKVSRNAVGDVVLAPGFTSWLGQDEAGFKRVIGELITWFESLYGTLEALTPSESPAWVRQDLEYTFIVSAPAGGEKAATLVAPNYRNGDLDWYTFSIQDHPQEISAGETKIQSFVPTRISYHGMPHPRWWAFEDAQTDFGNLDAVTTDLAKIMIMDFALIYGNDWFIVPLPLDVGTLTRIDSLKVRDVFNVETTIPRARSASEHPWQTWQMFCLSRQDAPDEVGDFLFLPPTVSFREESPPLEEVRFIHDEMANMVWGIEHWVLNGVGKPVDGFNAQTERRSRAREAAAKADLAGLEALTQELHEALAALEAAVTRGGATPEALATRVAELQARIAEIQARLASVSPPPAGEAPGTAGAGLPRYALASTVPDNWIPYVPVRVPGSDRSVFLRRAAMLTNEAANLPTMIPPMTQLLGGADRTSPLNNVHEEAVTRAGQKLQITRQRVRWIDGKTYVWGGRKVTVGKGEGSSGLNFDAVLKHCVSQ